MGKISKIVKKRIGRTDHTFFVEGDNLHQLIMEERKLSFGDVLNCGLCGGDDLILSAHVTESEGYDYTYIKCLKCKGTLNFGQQKKHDDIYYLRTVEITSGQYAGQKSYDWKSFNQS